MIGYDKMLKEPKYLPKGPAIIYGLKVELAFSLYFTNTIKAKFIVIFFNIFFIL